MTSERIDSKYQVLSELARDGHMVLYSVTASGQADSNQQETGKPALRLGWFEVSSSAQRSSFHRYRSALKALAPAGLLDVVARPGAYYTVWKPLEGQPLSAFLALPIRDELTVQALRDQATALAEQGFALSDAEMIFGDDDELQLAYLAPAEHSTEEAAALSAQVLSPLKKGKIRRRRPALSLWAVVPGLLFLGGAGYLGAQATRIYLNPPIQEVVGVTGQPAEDGARKLASSGFRVVYADGEAPGQAVGTVVSQDPAAGTSLPFGRQVTLTVNNPPPLTVPRLDDLSLAQVDVSLAENRLKRGPTVTIDGTFSGTPKGRVIAQLPASGATAQRGDRVTLIISSGIGSKQTWLPDLTGQNYDDALNAVRLAGLVVATVRRVDSKARENTVLTQKPAAFVKVDVGSPVALTVATVGFAGPSQSAGNLPLPSPPPPPPPPVTEPAQPANPGDPLPDGTSPNGTAPNGTGTPQTNPDGSPVVPATPPQSTPPQSTTQPATPEPATPAAETPKRTVRLDYTFPDNLPDGTVDIIVRDQDGERLVLNGTPTSSTAKTSAQLDGIEVRGDATFVVRVNGQEFTSFPASPAP